FQPSELAKLALAVWAASYLTRRRPPQTLKQLWRPIGLLATVFCVLLLAEPDLGTAITILLMLAGMLLVAGTPTRTLGAGLSIAGVVSLLAVWFEPYRRARLFSFINPWHDAQGAGYQTVQAIIGLGSGGVFGRGLGQSIEKANFLPEAHTDMIFAIIGEELGLIGAAAVIAAYGAFAYFGLRIALSDRGARVTFAGSPRRAEARLVPEAGFELDTFRVSGLPRRPGLAQAHAFLHALAAPAACDRILARRKPDVVLGAGSFVGGPMVLAAARRRIPAAVTEADAHLGLANRLAAPFVKRVFLSFPIEGHEPPKYEVVGRPLPANARPLPRAEARAQLGLPAEGPVLLVAGARA